jgi:hypothetical protein
VVSRSLQAELYRVEHNEEQQYVMLMRLARWAASMWHNHLLKQHANTFSIALCPFQPCD